MITRKWKAALASLICFSLLLAEVMLASGQPQAAVMAEGEAAEAGLVMNGGFEEIGGDGFAKDWKKASYTGAAYIGNVLFSLDTAIKNGGMQSVKMEAEGPESRGTVYQIIPVTEEMKGKSFTYSHWVKTENATKASARIQFYDAANKGMSGVTGGMIDAKSVQGTADWQLIELDFIILDRPEVASFRIETFLEKGKGTVWLDDISITPKYPLEAILFDIPSYKVPVNGEAIQLGVSLVPANTTDTEIVWRSSDPDTVSVQEGKVVAHRNGVATITASSKDGKIGASVIVYAGENGEDIVAEDETVSTEQGKPAEGNVLVSHNSGKQMSYRIQAQPSNGLAKVSEAGRWSYYPGTGFYGQDMFSVLISDPDGSYAVVQITVNVDRMNQPPWADNGLHAVNKGMVVNGKIVASDPDKDALTYSIAAQPLYGAIDFKSDGSYTYTPQADYAGQDAFTVLVADGFGGTAEAVVYIYLTPQASDIISELKDNNANHHPRLLATEADFSRIEALLDASDENMLHWLDNVQRSADNLLTQPVVPYNKPDGLRLDTSASSHIVTLAFAYRVTGNDDYLARAWLELENISSAAYKDWSPEHFLDTAMTTYGAAVGYDLLYDVLTAEQRELVREAIVEKGLKQALPLYSNMSGWTIDKNNWNFVCNAGMIAGAIAIADEEEAIAGQILHGAFKSLQHDLRQYAPDGSSLEGPAYWEYGTSYLVYLLSALTNAFGHDFGFSNYEGIKETPDYPLYITGTQGTFNYADNDPAFISGKLLLWFANRFDEPGYAWYHKFSNAQMDKAGLYDMLWYDADLYEGSEPPYKDYYFSRQHAMTMRSSWNDPNALFAGFKGGINGTPHGDLDIGTFVLDAYGVRWAMDLGKEDYNLPGYWDRSPGSARWTYYRKTPEGQNTIVINPSSKLQQDSKAVSPIIARDDNKPEGAFAIADMTEAYQDQVLSAKRGLALTNHRREFLVQDEITAKNQSELYWFMHSQAEIEVQPDGRTAVLSKDGKRLWVQLLAPANASLEVMNASPLPQSPNPSGQNANAGIKKLAVHLQNMTETTIALRMVPLLQGQALPGDTPAVVPLDQWTVESAAAAKLQAIQLNGQAMPEFEENQFVYSKEVAYGDPLPDITAVPAHPQHATEVEQIAPGVYRIKVIDPTAAAKSNEYFIEFKIRETRFGEPSRQEPAAGQPNRQTALSIQAIKASGHDGNVPENVLDGNLTTRWSDEGTSWLLLDLGEEKRVQQAAIAWYNGNKRSTFFDIEVSKDGYNWDWVYSGQGSGLTADLETYTLRESTGHFVRIKAYGNTVNAWNSITELSIHGEAVPIVPPYTPPVLSAEAGLQQLELTEVDGAVLSLSPAFRPELTSYTAETASGKVVISTQAVHPAAKIVISGQAGGSNIIALHEGENIISLQVQAENGTTKTYTLRITRTALNSSEEVFPDIEGHWAEPNILKAQQLGIVKGYSNGQFKPEQSITRAALTVMLARALKLDGNGEEPPFTDQQNSEWAKHEIAQAVAAGIINGFSDGSFRPNDNVTRAQAAVMIARAAGLSSTHAAETGFADHNAIPAWARGAIAELSKQKLIEGKSGKRFAPADQLTRAEAVVLLLRLLEYQAKQGETAVAAL